jgi:phage FluMu protein Com
MSKKIKCANCGKVLMEGKVGTDGRIEKTCPDCHELNVITDKYVTTKPKNTKPFSQRVEMERK